MPSATTPISESLERGTIAVPQPSAGEIADAAYDSLSKRVLFLPGEVVSRWFKTFPDKIPYEHGCGYRFAAPLLHCTFVDNSLTLYALWYPDYVKRGYHGSMNAAHFAEEYANFGPSGLFLAGFLAAGALAVAATATSRAGLVGAVILNLPYIAALGSTALHTTLLSGGWALMMILVFVLFSSRRLEPVDSRAPYTTASESPT
jgi:hypothetical protein